MTPDDEPPRAPRRLWIWALVAAGLALVAALAVPGIAHLREVAPAPPAPLELSWTPPAGLVLGGGPDHPFGLALAPDGRRLVYPASRSGDVALWLHDLRSGRVETLPGTGGGLSPFWSSDGRGVAFVSGGHLRILDIGTGRVDDGGEASASGGAWLPSGELVIARLPDAGLARYRLADRQWTTFTEIDRDAGEIAHRLPVATIDGTHVVFYVAADRPSRAGIWLAAIDRPEKRVRLTGSDAHGILQGDSLLYSSDGSLVAQRLDRAARALAGRPALVALSAGIGPTNQLFATAAADVIAYAEPASSARELVWTDRSGTVTGTLAGPVHAWDVRIAPVGSSVASTRMDPQLATLDVWVYDEGRPIPRRISPGLDIDDSVVWAPDAVRLAWVSARTTVMVRGRQALVPEDRVRRFESRVRLWDWSRSNRLVAGVAGDTTRDDLWIMDASGSTEPGPYARSPFNEVHAAVSPNGRWLAYASDESGRYEIYVDRFPTPGARVRVTADGGADPRWRADGRELVFRRGDDVYVVAIGFDGDTLEARATSRLFSAGPDVRAYDVTRDGGRFLLNRPMPGVTPPNVRVVVNWRAPIEPGR